MDLLFLSKTIHIWLVNILIIFFIIRSMVSIIIKEDEPFITDKIFIIILYLSIGIMITGLPLFLSYNYNSSIIFYSKIVLSIIFLVFIVMKFFLIKYHTLFSYTLILVTLISIYSLSLFLELMNAR